MKRPFSPGIDVPDDIVALCESMDHDGVSLPEEDSNHCRSERGVLHKKIKRLKADKRTLRQDLARSRQIGRTLELDVKRLRHQRQQELSCERRAQHGLQEREVAVTSREHACTLLQRDLVSQKNLLLFDLHSYEQNEVDAVVRNLVDRVELSAKEAEFGFVEEDLAWSSGWEEDCRQCAAWMEREAEDTEDFVVVEQQLLNDQVKSMKTQLEASQERLREEEQTSVVLKNGCFQMQQENAWKTTIIAVLAQANMTLANAQAEQITKIGAQRDEWDRSAREQQQKHEEVLAEHTKQQTQLAQVENSRLQQKLREAQLGELKGQQQISAAHTTEENSKRELERLKTKVKTLQGELKERKRDVASPQFHVPISANIFPVKPKSSVGRLRTLRGTGSKN